LQRGRAVDVGRQRQCGQRRAGTSTAEVLALEAWLRRVKRVNSATGIGALVRLAQDLERVPASEAVAASHRAVEAVRALLARACVCTDGKLPPFLSVFTRVLERHPRLKSQAQRGEGFTRNACTLLERAGACQAMYSHPLHVAQVAVAQQRLGIAVPAYWRRLATAMPPHLGGREVANVYHTYATLASKGLQADAGLCAQLERLAEHTASDMNAQEVANTFWALAMLGKAPQASLKRALCGAAECVAHTMTPQAIANVLWAFAELGEAPTPGARAAMLKATARTAPDMAALEVSSTLLSLALLQAPLHGGLQAALLGAVHARLPEMNAQSLANLLFAAAWFHIDQGAAMLPTEVAFSSLAGRRNDLELEEYRQVQL
jgi:hypothetical protein